MSKELRELLSLEVGGVSYHVTKYPDRRQHCLMRTVSNEYMCVQEPVAYFKRDEDARKFAEWLDRVSREVAE